jgi:tetraspanin-13/31
MAVRLCGFAAIRCCLTLLNVFYIATSLFLIGVVVASRALSYFTSPSILAGLAVCASILFLVAVLGLAGTIKHHQVVLFFVSKTTSAWKECNCLLSHSVTL